MDKPKFVYVTYITTTPEKLWNALRDSEMTTYYWGHRRNASDWKVGSKWEHRDYDDAKLVDIVGKVVESVPPRRLVLTWAYPADAANEAAHSRVTFEIEQFGEAVRLTVTHEEFKEGSDMLPRISYGWPVVLSSLKTMLETGKAMTMTTTRTGWPPRT
jgi:uncharacterized protein YndB with AHSA1/START domain